MPFLIPYTFQAGTKAKANEVNENFLAVKQFVDLLEQDSAQLQVNVSDIEANKADLNGNSNVRFQVDDAVNGKDAVNLDTLKEQVANTLDYISGFVLTRVSDTQVRASAGSCYDSTLEHMITSTGNLTLTASGLGANATYYVYVVATADGSATPKLAYGTSSSTVALPGGYDIYRRLGYFTTDADADILNVSSESGNATQGIYIVSMGWSGTSWWRTYSNGWKECGGQVIHTDMQVHSDTVRYPNNIRFTRNPCGIQVADTGYGGQETRTGNEITSYSTTQFVYKHYGFNTGFFWEAKGY